MIRRQIVVPVDRDRLWRALTDPVELADWFGGTVEWDLREGGPLRFRGSDGSRRDGRVEAVRPGQHLRFCWWPVDPGDRTRSGPGSSAGGAAATDTDTDAVSRSAGAGADGEVASAIDDPASEVTYLLVADGDGTRLTIQERPVDVRPAAQAAGPVMAQAAGPVTAQAAGPVMAQAAGPADWSDWDDRLARHWLRVGRPLAAAGGARY